MQDGTIAERALQALEAGRFAEAQELLEAVRDRQQPGQGLVWAILARTYFQLRNFNQARAAADRAFQLAGRDPAVQHTLALYYAQSGDRRRAAELEALFARSPAADRAASARAALLLHEVGMHRQAAELGEQALAVQDRAEVRIAVARSYEALIQPEAAIRHYRALLTSRPQDEVALTAFSEALLRMARFGEAVSLLEQGCERWPASPQLNLNLGVAYYAQRRFRDAASRFLRVIELAPDVEQPYVFLARMLEQLGDLLPRTVAAFAAWDAREGANHLPPFVHAKAISVSGGDRALARARLEESIRRNAKFWESHFELGALLEQDRQWETAASELERSVALDPRQASVRYRLARIYDRLGDRDRAALHRKAHAELLAAEKSAPGMGAVR